MLGAQGLAQQGIVEQVDLSHCQVVGCSPVGVELSNLLGSGHSLTPGALHGGAGRPDRAWAIPPWHGGDMRVLVVNAGSSSLKLSILDGDDSSLMDV